MAAEEQKEAQVETVIVIIFQLAQMAVHQQLQLLMHTVAKVAAITLQALESMVI